MVTTDCRRSERVQALTKGFKRSTCSHRDCIACDGVPPTLSTNIIKDLGVTFCKMGPEALSDAALLQKKTKKVTVGKGQSTTEDKQKKTAVTKLSAKKESKSKKASSKCNTSKANGKKSPDDKTN